MTDLELRDLMVSHRWPAIVADVEGNYAIVARATELFNAGAPILDPSSMEIVTATPRAASAPKITSA